MCRTAFATAASTVAMNCGCSSFVSAMRSLISMAPSRNKPRKPSAASRHRSRKASCASFEPSCSDKALFSAVRATILRAAASRAAPTAARRSSIAARRP